MMDTTVTGPDDGDQMNENVELPVDIDTLAINGTAPAVGDQVDLKVSGSVTRVVNKMAYVKPEMVNDTPLPSAPLETDPMTSEDERLQTLSKTMGGIPGYGNDTV